MAKRITERRIVDVLMNHIRQTCLAAREVKHYEKRIDVAAVFADPDEVWAIEAKVSNWRRALGQAIVNMPTAHRSYIAVYDKNAHRVDLQELEKHGVGLIAVGSKWGQVKVVRDAPDSPYANPLALERIRQEVTRENR